MDVLSFRKTQGRREGRILLNGVDATHAAMARQSGYCEQVRPATTCPVVQRS